MIVPLSLSLSLIFVPWACRSLGGVILRDLDLRFVVVARWVEWLRH